jgi:hypothetical protein
MEEISLPNSRRPNNCGVAIDGNSNTIPEELIVAV